MALLKAQWRQIVLDARADVTAKEAAYRTARASLKTVQGDHDAAQTALSDAQVALDALRTARRLIFAETDE